MKFSLKVPTLNCAVNKSGLTYVVVGRLHVVRGGIETRDATEKIRRHTVTMSMVGAFHLMVIWDSTPGNEILV